jgi:hypothetical protein
MEAALREAAEELWCAESKRFWLNPPEEVKQEWIDSKVGQWVGAAISKHPELNAFPAQAKEE